MHPTKIFLTASPIAQSNKRENPRSILPSIHVRSLRIFSEFMHIEPYMYTVMIECGVVMRDHNKSTI
jgi:hypothetical protein